MSYSGFQLGHPNLILASNATTKNERFAHKVWGTSQRLVASIALIILSPIITVMWLLVKVSSPGPFLFKQQRPGMNGSTFTVYKMRTMQSGSEKETALGVTNSNPQVTAIGKILRALKLDELPQLWNVVSGSMALVGPRPIPIPLDQELRTKIPNFKRRYEVRPGLTSIGQICVHDNALGDALVEDWELRFEGELHYLENRSVSYDFLMILMTILYLFKKLTSFNEKN